MLRSRLTTLFNLRGDEAGAVIAGFTLFFLLFAGYFLLRPVRETMGLTGGVKNLQWLFTGTFVSTLAAMPVFGWVAGRVQRRRILYWVFGFFASNLAAFAFGFLSQPDNVWLARTFYIWLSVFNLIAISVAWSVLVDLFAVEQAKRLFGLMAAGASLGGLVGPLLGVLLVGSIGHAGLLLLSAGLLVAAAVSASAVQRWREAHPLGADESTQRHSPLGGSPVAGATEVLKSPYMLGIAVFVLLLASVNTFLYFEQARLVAVRFPDSTEQTRIFGLIDTTVQMLAILSQLFITGRVAQRLGIGVLLVAVPVIAMCGFVWLAFAPTFAVLAVVMVARRAGEYAFVRPGREMLWTAVSTQAKYKAKNFVDTVVYRGADAVSSWLKIVVDMIAQQPAVAALFGALIALLWAINGGALARAHRRMDTQAPAAQDAISV
ncbi:MAG: MFS transporter [Rhodanobacteraceae bacterium]